MLQRSRSSPLSRGLTSSSGAFVVTVSLSLLLLMNGGGCCARSLHSVAGLGDADHSEHNGAYAVDAHAGQSFAFVQGYSREVARQLRMESTPEQDLFRAAVEGERDAVMRLLKAGVDLETVDDEGNTPLIRATITGQVDVMRLLLDEGADIDARGHIGATALYAAVNTSQIAALQLLIEKGANTEIRTDLGSTPLWRAAADGKVEFVKALLEAGANVDARHSSSGFTPLLTALHLNRVDVAKELLNGGADVEATARNGATALHEAASSGNLELVSIVLETKPAFGVDPVGLDGQFTPLMFAAWLGHADVVLELIQKGANASFVVGRGERTALHWAAMHANNSVIMEMFIEEGLDINLGDGSGHPPVALAAWRGNVDNVKYLLEQGAERNLGGVIVCGCANSGACESTNCRTDDVIQDIKDLLGIRDLETIVDAVKENNVELLKQLIKNGTAVNVSDADGNPAIVLAASQGRVDIVTMLLDNGADPNAAAETDGVTPLHAAVYFHHTEAVKLLLSRGAAVDAQNAERFTPTHFAAQNGFLDIMRLLIDAGADVDMQTNRTGATPLALAVAGVHEDVIRELLDSGADPTIESDGGVTLLHIASRKSGIRNILQLLIDEGLDANAVTLGGSPPLEFAAYFGNREAILLLLLAGADPTIGEGDGAGDEVCGCVGNVGILQTIQCPPGACTTVGQIKEIEMLLRRHKTGNSRRTNDDSTGLESRQEVEDCESFPTMIAQLECVATQR